MYKCDHNLNSCLSVSAYRIGGGIEISSSNSCKEIDVTARRIGDILNVSSSVVGSNIEVAAKPTGHNLVVTCSLICTINKSLYLNVNPDYVWLTPDMLSSGEFDIISNVDWNIV